MKTAVIRQRRTLADGSRLVLIVCPACDHRHWTPATPVGHCPRRHSDFAIPTRENRP